MGQPLTPQDWEKILKAAEEADKLERAKDVVVPPDAGPYEVQATTTTDPPRNLVGSPSDPDTLYAPADMGPIPALGPARVKNINAMREFIYYGDEASKLAGKRHLQEQETARLLEDLRLTSPETYASVIAEIQGGVEGTLADAYLNLPPHAKLLVDSRVEERLPYYLSSRMEVVGRTPFNMIVTKEDGSRQLDVTQARKQLKDAIATYKFQEMFGRQPDMESWEWMKTREPERFAEFMADVDRLENAEWTRISSSLLHSGVIFTNQFGATEAILAGDTAPGGIFPWSSMPKAISTSTPVQAGRALVSPVEMVATDVKADQVIQENPIVSLLRPLSMGTAFLAAPLVSDIRGASEEKPQGGEAMGTAAELGALATGPLWPATVWARFLMGEDIGVDDLPPVVIAEGLTEVVPWLYQELGSEESIRWLRESGDITTAIPEIKALAKGAMINAGYPEDAASLISDWSMGPLVWTMAIAEPDYGGAAVGLAVQGTHRLSKISEAKTMLKVADTIEDAFKGFPTDILPPVTVREDAALDATDAAIADYSSFDPGILKNAIEKVDAIDPRAAHLLELELAATAGQHVDDLGKPVERSTLRATMGVLEGQSARAMADMTTPHVIKADDAYKGLYDSNWTPEQITVPPAGAKDFSSEHVAWDRNLRLRTSGRNPDEVAEILQKALDEGIPIKGARDSWEGATEQMRRTLGAFTGGDPLPKLQEYLEIKDQVKVIPEVDAAYQKLAYSKKVKGTLLDNYDATKTLREKIEANLNDANAQRQYAETKVRDPGHPEVRNWEAAQAILPDLIEYENMLLRHQADVAERVALRTKAIPIWKELKDMVDPGIGDKAATINRLASDYKWRKSATKRLQRHVNTLTATRNQRAAMALVAKTWTESLRGTAQAIRREAKKFTPTPKATIKATPELWEGPPSQAPVTLTSGERLVNVPELQKILEPTPLGKKILNRLNLSPRDAAEVQKILDDHPIFAQVLNSTNLAHLLRQPSDQLKLLQELDSLQSLNVLEGMKIDGSLRAESYRRTLNSATALDKQWMYEPMLALRRVMQGDPHFQRRLGDLDTKVYEALRAAENSYHQVLSELFELGITKMTDERLEVLYLIYNNSGGPAHALPRVQDHLKDLIPYLQTINVLLSTNQRIPLGAMPTVSNIGRMSLWDKTRLLLERNVHVRARDLGPKELDALVEVLDAKKAKLAGLKATNLPTDAKEILTLEAEIKVDQRNLDFKTKGESSHTKKMPVYIEVMVYSFLNSKGKLHFRDNPKLWDLVDIIHEEAKTTGDAQTFIERVVDRMVENGWTEHLGDIRDIWEGTAKSVAMASSEYNMIEQFRRSMVGVFSAAEARALDLAMGGDWAKVLLGNEGIPAIDFDQLLMAAEKMGIPMTNTIHRTAADLRAQVNGIVALSAAGQGHRTDWFVLNSLIEAFEGNYASLVTQLRGDPVTVPSMFHHARKVFSDYVGLSMRSMVLGILYVNPRNLVNSIASDWSQMVRTHGWVDATVKTFTNLPAHFTPRVHRGAEKWKAALDAERAAQGALSLPKAAQSTVLNAVLNPFLADFYNNPNFIIDTLNGPAVHADTAWEWMKEDGILEAFGDALQIRDMAQAAQVDGRFQKLAAWWATHNYKIADFSNYIQQRRRVALYLDVLVRTGGSREAARSAVHEALYDWKHGAPQAILESLSFWAPFIRWRVLEHYNLKKMMLEPLTMSPTEWTLRSLLWQTKMGRVQKLAEIQARGWRLTLDEDATDEEEQAWLRSMFRSRWTTTRFTIYGESVDAYGQEWNRRRGKQVDAIQYLTPSFSPVDQVMFYWAVTALLGGGLMDASYSAVGKVPPLAYNWHEKPLGMVLENLYPHWDTSISSVMEGWGMGTDSARKDEWTKINPELAKFMPELLTRQLPSGGITYPSMVAGTLALIPGFGPQIWTPLGQTVNSPEWSRRELIQQRNQEEDIWSKQLPLYERVFRGTIDAVAKVTKVVPARYYTSSQAELNTRTSDAEKALDDVLKKYDRTAVEDAVRKQIWREEESTKKEK